MNVVPRSTGSRVTKSDGEIFIWGKNERKTGGFRYSMTIANSPLVA